MIVKRSVTQSIAQALSAIVLLSLLTTGLALVTLLSSQRDAEAINLAGSLRMQSYRMAWDASRQPQIWLIIWRAISKRWMPRCCRNSIGPGYPVK